MAAHAGIKFAIAHPELALAWENASNALVVLGIPDENAVLDEHEDARWDGIPCSLFYEPDIEEYTACALLLTDEEAQRFRKLQLILRDPCDPRWQRESALRLSLQSILEGGE